MCATTGMGSGGTLTATVTESWHCCYQVSVRLETNADLQAESSEKPRYEFLPHSGPQTPSIWSCSSSVGQEALGADPDLLFQESSRLGFIWTGASAAGGDDGGPGQGSDPLGVLSDLPTLVWCQWHLLTTSQVDLFLLIWKAEYDRARVRMSKRGFF